MTPCIVTGEVVHGKNLGKTVGMPTANLGVDGATLGIPCGVYASLITVKGETYIGLTNLGSRPTVDNHPGIIVETYILDFDQDIYGEIVTLEIRYFIRDIRKFHSLEAVKNQVQKDIDKAREYFTFSRRPSIAAASGHSPERACP
jgi:riboflavin kinase/FMN adenylyltransferase